MHNREGKLQFPEGFLWGTATASYQVEGAVQENGRVLSIWDTFSHTPGKVLLGHTGDVACDHFHRYKEDIALMADLGIDSYRFSVAWPRVVSEDGRIHADGFDFYKRLVDELLRHRIQPAATLFHWDLPQFLEDRGGWSNRDTVSYYLEYAEAAFRTLGDQIQFWITQNEPWCASMLGYGIGEHAPGLRDWRKAYRSAHHLLLSHGEAVKLYRGLGETGQIGITLNFTPAYPGSDREEDIAAAARQDIFANRWFLDPITKGKYPTEFFERLERYIGSVDFIEDTDMEKIASEIDFLGINFYNPGFVLDDPGSESLVGVKHVKTGRKVTDMGWEVEPQALYELLKRIQGSTDKPLYITENGAAYNDAVVDGKVDDVERVEYIQGHLEAAHRFVSEGGNLNGYYLWSLLDNFEWAYGYTKRFGITHVDFDTQQRIPKESFQWYKRVIREKALPGVLRTVE